MLRCAVGMLTLFLLLAGKAASAGEAYVQEHPAVAVPGDLPLTRRFGAYDTTPAYVPAEVVDAPYYESVARGFRPPNFSARGWGYGWGGYGFGSWGFGGWGWGGRGWGWGHGPRAWPRPGYGYGGYRLSPFGQYPDAAEAYSDVAADGLSANTIGAVTPAGAGSLWYPPAWAPHYGAGSGPADPPYRGGWSYSSDYPAGRPWYGGARWIGQPTYRLGIREDRLEADFGATAVPVDDDFPSTRRYAW